MIIRCEQLKLKVIRIRGLLMLYTTAPADPLIPLRKMTTLNSQNTPWYSPDLEMPNDMTNFMEYQIMGKVSKILMKSGCIPTKFECQEDRRKRMSSIIERPYIVKKQRTETIAECLNEYNKSCTTSSSLEDTSNIISNCKLGEENVQEVISKTSDKFVQALITHKFRSKAVQAGPKYKDQALSPLKPSLVSSFTSPFKVKTFKKSRPSEMGKITRNIFTEDEPSDGEILYTQEISGVTHLLCIHCKPNHLLTAAKYLKITRNNNKLRRLYRTH
ncbi:hypothetical protein EVAR_66489_1 [Eumeta japonica]|uniref:Uncharacterized protein n=1 Tax=Eumeta variegata TaxID=151549 RepID=A0A4C2ACA8_EUMVA|nr:hypothetical protein EVAR_66489_1 [Eumeta japonica]